MLKLLLRRSGTKDLKPAVTSPAAAGEITQGELWLNNNHESPALFARADDDTLIEFDALQEPPNGTANGTIQYARQVVTTGTTQAKSWAPVVIPPGTHVGETPPANPKQGQQWFRSDTGKLYVWYDDGAGAAQWVVANPQEAVDYSKVLTKPAVAGVAGQVLSTNGSGALSWATPSGGGKILQVVNATYSVNTSTASVNYIDSGLRASITPLSRSNKVLVLVNHASCYKTGSDTFLLFQLLRGSTSLVEFERYGGHTASVATIGIGSCSTAYLDSPATTSLTTYKTQLRSSSGTTGAGFGANSATSTITLIEVAA